FYTKSHVSWCHLCVFIAGFTNPLTLDPPEVIGRYDDIVMVNCTTSYDFHDKMYWKVGQADPIEEEEISFVTLPLTLSNWSLNAKCNININDSIECSKNLEITVYKLPDVVSVVGPDVMVEGTEYPLVCDIINVTPLQNLNVKWYRGNETVHTQIVSGTSVTPVNVSLTLMVTAGRDLGGAHFRCEVELIFGANGPEFIPTATSSPYTAAVFLTCMIFNILLIVKVIFSQKCAYDLKIKVKTNFTYILHAYITLYTIGLIFVILSNYHIQRSTFFFFLSDC
uniref:Ig-like domain-containing protein n=1 Tax=Mola mola TaxID=94237 RepID=A0A3Q4BA76_MOLML